MPKGTKLAEEEHHKFLASNDAGRRSRKEYTNLGRPETDARNFLKGISKCCSKPRKEDRQSYQAIS